MLPLFWLQPKLSLRSPEFYITGLPDLILITLLANYILKHIPIQDPSYLKTFGESSC